MRGLIVFVLATLIAGVAPAFADDWTASRLRGVVFEHVNGNWERMERGDVVPDTRVIRTGSGRVTLTRGKETIELGPNTQIRIFDKGGEKPFTTVRQEFGEVAVEAEVRDVQHFAVQTPYLVAVVKGTRFTVEADEQSSEVVVRRGVVYVENLIDGSHTLLRAGQSARTVAGARLEVDGRGELPEVVGGLEDPAGGNEDLLGLGLLGDDGLLENTVEGVGDLANGAVGTVGNVANGAVGTVGNVVNGAVGTVGNVVNNVVGGGDGDDDDDGGGGLVGGLLGGLL